jgi:hypothetical protein
LIPNNRSEKFSSRFLHSEIIGAGMCSYAATPLIIALSPDLSNITRFRPWLTIATENHLDRTEIIINFAQPTSNFDIYDPRSDISGPTLRRDFACSNLYK